MVAVELCLQLKRLHFVLQVYRTEHMNTLSLTKRTQYTDICTHVISIRNFCKLPDTFNSDNFPPDFSCNKEFFPQLPRHNVNTFTYTPQKLKSKPFM